MEYVINKIGLTYEQVLVIGSDSPNLPVEFIREAAKKIKQTQCVLGPTEDGGYYLLGVKPPVEGLADIRWSTGNTFNDTKLHFEKHGIKVALTPMWFDVDTKEDLERLYGNKR